MTSSELSDLVQEALRTQAKEETDPAATNPALEAIIDHASLPDAFALADRLVRSSLPSDKKLGVRILRELGRPQMPYAAKSVRILQTLIDNHPDTKLLIWTISALGNQHREEALPSLWILADNPEPSVRDAVCGAISGAAAQSTLDDRSIEILVRLALDPDRNVRFSATFELAAWRSHGIIDQRVVQALEQANWDSDPQVAKAARLDLADEVP